MPSFYTWALTPTYLVLILCTKFYMPTCTHHHLCSHCLLVTLHAFVHARFYLLSFPLPLVTSFSFLSLSFSAAYLHALPFFCLHLISSGGGRDLEADNKVVGATHISLSHTSTSSFPHSHRNSTNHLSFFQWEFHSVRSGSDLVSFISLSLFPFILMCVGNLISLFPLLLYYTHTHLFVVPLCPCTPLLFDIVCCCWFLLYYPTCYLLLLLIERMTLCDYLPAMPDGLTLLFTPFIIAGPRQ